MRRRELIAALAGAAAWPLAARAQQPDRMPRIGVIEPLSATDPEAQMRVSALREGLQDLGWVAGRNMKIENRWAPGGTDRIREQAVELVSLAPDVIVAASTPVVTALRAETRTIPVLFVQVVDPVAVGFVKSFARPGGNATGITNFEPTMGGKWLATLKEISPQLTRAAVLYNPKTAPYAGLLLRSIADAAPSFAMEPIDTPIQGADEIDRAIGAFVQKPNGGLLVLPDAGTLFHRELIIARAAQHRLPAVYPFRYFPISGGLISYGTDAANAHRQIASYVDRILRGAKPEELPVQAPTKFELVINLTTARVLGITVPDKLLALADEVIN